MKNAQIAFLNAPFYSEGCAFSQGWGALLAISSSPLVPHGPADRRGVGIRSVSGVGRTDTFFICLSIYLSIYLIIIIIIIGYNTLITEVLRAVLRARL